MTKYPPVVLIPSSGPNDWRVLLHDPEEHWRKGRSAYELAHSWEAADGDFPIEVAEVLLTEPKLDDLRPLLVIPEYQHTPSRQAPRTGVCVLARGQRAGLATIAVEATAGEGFGPVMSEWRKRVTHVAHRERALAFALNFPTIPDTIRCELLKCTASAVFHVERFGARHAVMLVQSFSKDDRFEDYAAFVALYDAETERDRIVRLGKRAGTAMWAGWVDMPAAEP